ncbi:MAG: hypothetical protein IJW00_08350 [Clostridia bacterium]|nr:hypothetical protein [Clostridia bacterium]
MNMMLSKLRNALAIALVALQIPMLMLWKITYDTVKLACHKLEIVPSGRYTLELQRELLGEAIVTHLPVILSLVVCFVLSILSLIFVIKRKGGMGITGVCFNAVSLVACGFVLYVFAVHSDMFNLSEFMFFRYFMGSELNLTRIIPFWHAIKYIFLGLHMAANAALGGLGIAEVMIQKKAVPIMAQEKEVADV